MYANPVIRVYKIEQYWVKEGEEVSLVSWLNGYSENRLTYIVSV